MSNQQMPLASTASASGCWRLMVADSENMNFWEAQTVHCKRAPGIKNNGFVRLCGTAGASVIVPFGKGIDGDEGDTETIKLHYHLRELLGYRLGDSIKAEPIGSPKDAEAIIITPVDTAAIYSHDGTPNGSAATGADSPCVVRYEPVELSPEEILSEIADFISRSPGHILVQGCYFSLAVGGKRLDFLVAHTSEQGPCRVKTASSITVSDMLKRRVHLPRFSMVGGYEKTLEDLKALLCLPRDSDKNARKLGVAQARGILLHGPTGVGKSMIIKALANEVGMRLVTVDGLPTIDPKEQEPDIYLSKKFTQAVSEHPAILFIDNIDELVLRQDSNNREGLDHMFLRQLLMLMTQPFPGVTVIAATSRVHEIDSQLRSSNRFPYEIEIGIPSKTDRESILTKILSTRGLDPDKRDDIIAAVAARSHGYVGADLELVCDKAAHHRLKQTTTFGSATGLFLTMDDFEHALDTTKPSQLRSTICDIPTVSWDDIGGLDDIKQKLERAIDDVLNREELFNRYNIPLPRGILLYGPPGCGKTIVAKAVASMKVTNFISVRGPEFFDKYVGESESHIRHLFSKARASAPCIIFFDEIDAIAQRRGRTIGQQMSFDGILTQLLTELDGMVECKRVFVIGATNQPGDIDGALLRPGRLDEQVYIGLPDLVSREKILLKRLQRFEGRYTTVDIKKLAGLTEGYSGADLRELCRNAFNNALETAGCPIDMDISLTPRDFQAAFLRNGPSVNKEVLEVYKRFHSERVGRERRISEDAIAATLSC